MRNLINSMLTLCLLGMVTSATFAQSTLTLTYGNAINVAGKQRFLSQRMGKAFIFKALNIQSDIASKELASSIIIFEENLKALKAFIPEKSTARVLLSKEEVLWDNYKKLLGTETSKENAQNVFQFNNQILGATNDLVVELIKIAATQPKKDEESAVSVETIANNTNTAGRMRMLSQRLAFYYSAHYLGLNTPNNDIIKQLQLIATGIQSGMSALMISDVNTSEIDDAISNVIIDWRSIEERCSKDNCISFEEKNIAPAELYVSTNKILAKMDKATSLYAKLLN